MTAIMPQVRREFTDNAKRVLKERYLEPNEDVSSMFRRVANSDERFIAIMANHDFLPNSPTLMNAGTPNEGKSTFSACFKFDVADSMLEGEDSIIETGRKAAGVAKWGGGVGYYLGNLRGRLKPIRSVHRVACGPVNVLKWYNDIGTLLITQGGRRELAQMAIMPTYHDDIREFIHVKDQNPQALRTFNISVSASDAFMRVVTSPEVLGDGPEATLWREIVDSAWKTGDPGLFFFDTAERGNPTPHLGQLTGTNPCGEVPLLNNEACNLGSINLANFVTANRTIDWDRLGDVVCLATEFLDSILDRNCFPHPAITRTVALTRKLGLGVMAWADMLALLGMHYDSEEAVLLAERLMKFIDERALETSIRLAKLKGPYPGYEGKTAGEKHECRNSTRTCLAPTGSIGFLVNAGGGGCEPFPYLEWTRKINAGVKEKEYTVTEKIGVWERLDGFVPHVANDIHWKWHVRHQAAFQKHTNLAVSKTINLPNSATRKDIDEAYKLMWSSGCKGGTIFRDKCRETGEQVLNDKKTFVPEPSSNGHVKPEKAEGKCRRLPTKERAAVIKHIRIGDEFDGYVHAGMYDDGTLCEVFVTSGKEGSTVSGLLDSWAIAVSHALQYGDPLENLVKKYSGMRFEPSGMTGDKDIPICTSIVDYVMRWLDLRFGKGRTDENHKGHKVPSGQLCPKCHNSMVYQGGCITCPGCGHSRCG